MLLQCLFHCQLWHHLVSMRGREERQTKTHTLTDTHRHTHTNTQGETVRMSVALQGTEPEPARGAKNATERGRIELLHSDAISRSKAGNSSVSTIIPLSYMCDCEQHTPPALLCLS